MKLKISAGGVPAGNYQCRFKGIEAVTHDQYGPGLRWNFEIVSGPLAGQVASRTTSPTPTPRNGAGKLLSGVIGGPLAVDSEVDLSQFVGRNYLVVVEQVASGGTAIATVIGTGT